MVSKLFVVRNKLSGFVDQSYVLPNELVASIDLCPFYAKRSPIDEWELCLIGEIDISTMDVTPLPHRTIEWDFRRITSND